MLGRRYENLIASYTHYVDALRYDVKRLEAFISSNTRKQDAIVKGIRRKPQAGSIPSASKMIDELGGLRPENYDKVIAYLDKKITSLQQYIENLHH